jgi:hypothetical protein
MKITKEQIEEFKSTDFLVIHDLYNAEKMKQIIEWTEKVTNYPEVPDNVMMYFEQSKLEPGNRIIARIEDIASFHDDKRLSYPPDIERQTDKEYVFRV